ncbi:hypothetical protein AN958_09343 [Leucoagaricus sp. SymC.cos]|nr:hypothetical protein AN958_09343 [Leucoagaricus sp. SymC.cos]
MPPAPPTAQQKANFEYAVVAALMLVSWELLVHGFQDLNYLRRIKTLWRRPVMWAYFIQRYGAFAVIVAQANIRLGKHTDCHAAGLVSLIVGGVFVLPSISLIYLYRVLAIWNKKPVIKWVLIALWVAVFGASLTAPSSQSANNLRTGGCTITRSEKYTPASFIANAVYDGVVFVLTIVRLGLNIKQYSQFKSPVQILLLRDGVLYFAVSVAIGIVDIVFLEAIKQPVVASTVIPLHIALASVMTARLVNNVFHVLKADEVGPHFISDTRGGRNKKTISVKSAMAFVPGASAGTATTGTVLVVGSGVATDYFDEISRSEGEASKTETLGTKSNAYAIPLNVRSWTDATDGGVLRESEERVKTGGHMV